ncbi:MAG: hypothetical protein A2046_07070 [Bacteroidetes bacterium GWA2_30_7]|nr:MAG: hypothetical protein A2046_07070 [Bacteroidetes bacterium GWA2_30_7]
MIFKIVFRARFSKQMLSCYSWYEEKQIGLGEDFLQNVEMCINSISQNPFLFQIKYKNVRMALTERFPYGIFYFVENNKIIVLSIFHLSRNPKLWSLK